MATFNNITAESFAEETLQEAGRKRRRYREAVSCLQCRQKKVKCDRNQPCNQCKTRKTASKCKYVQTGSFRSPQGESFPSSPEGKRSVSSQSRISVADEGHGERSHCTITHHGSTERPQQQQQQQQQQSLNSSFPALTPPTSDHSQPTSAPLPSSPVSLSEMVFPSRDMPNWATAERVNNSLGINLDTTIQFDPSVSFGSPSRPLQQDYFTSSYPVTDPRSSLPHCPHSFPFAIRNFPAGVDLSRYGAEATTQQASPLMNEPMLMSWMEEESRTNSLSMDFEHHWGN